MKQLRIPGPTPLPPESRKAAGRQMINHRGKEFSDLLFRLTKKFQKIFQTKNDVLFLTCSGTGGMESSIVNLFSPREKVIVCSMGYFGDRFGAIAEAFGLKTVWVKAECGSPISASELEKTLGKHPDAKGVLLTHNETSTGVTNDIEKLVLIIKRRKILMVVDAISSLGAITLKVDLLGIDVAIAASQKATMAPPGIAMISISAKAWSAHAKSKLTRYYWDFSLAKKYALSGYTPSTPAISCLFALDVSSDIILRSGLRNTLLRHTNIAKRFRKSLKFAGFRLLADDRCASATVTAAMLPEELTDRTADFIKIVKQRFNVEIAAGLGKLKGKIFRVSHMGYISEKDAQKTANALKSALKMLYN